MPDIHLPYNRYQFDLPSGFGDASEEAANKKIEQTKEAARNDAEHSAMEDKVLNRIANQPRSQSQTPSYALPGHQGVLGEVGGEPEWHKQTGEKPPDPEWHKPIAEYSEAEKAQRVSDIAKHLGVPMQPGRQVASFANKQHLPKKEGAQGTLFSVGRYRP